MEEEEMFLEPEEEFEDYIPDYSYPTVDPNENSKESMKETMARNVINNRAEALKNNIKAYQNSNKNNLNNNDLKNSTSGEKPSSTKTLNKGKNSTALNAANLANSAKEKGLKDPETKKEALKAAGTAAAAYAGISPEMAEKVMNSKAADKALDKITKNDKKKKESDAKPKSEEAELESTEADTKKGFLIAGILCGSIVAIFIIMIAAITVAAVEFIDSVTFGFADDVIEEKVEEFIEDNYDDLGEKIDETVGFNNLEINPNNIALATTDLSISAYNKINILSLKLFKKVSKSNPASEEDLETFFGSEIFDVAEEDKDIVMLFYSKLYNINTYYQKNYNVSLDIPLIMSTLYVESDDKIEIFKSNAEKYNPKKDDKYFDYDYDWSNQKLKKNNSEHDIEILAQAMVKKTDDTYSYDEEQYFEFLKQFIEVKYYLDDDQKLGDSANYATSGIDGFPLKQGDSRWGSYKLGTSSGSTLAKVGCAVTSLTMIIRMSGVNTTVSGELTPDKTASKMSFSSGGAILNWTDVSKVAPDMSYVTVINISNKRNIIEKINSYGSNYYFLLHVGLTKRGEPHHFVAVNYTDSAKEKIYIYDPSRDISEVSDGYDVYTMLIFKVS